MELNCEIDDLDKQILQALLKDARMPFLELARALKVSGGTIHTRVEKLKQAGIIKGSKILIDAKQLDLNVVCFIGVILKNSKDYLTVLNKMRSIKEITEVYYTTGKYNLFAKIITKNLDQLYTFLIKNLQTMNEIQSTETLIVLDHPINRDITVYEKISPHNMKM